MPDKKKEKKVCVVGSGNAGTALAKIISTNCSRLSTFQDEVTMYVYEEVIDGKKLSDIINELHENVKYLPGRSLGANVVAVADIMAAARDADVIVFTFPHQQIHTVCAALLGKVKKTAVGVVAIKGFDPGENKTLELASRVIANLLKIQTCVLTGLAFPGEVVAGKPCETTLSCKSTKTGAVLIDLLRTDSLQVILQDDVETVELVGTLRTVVGCAAGVADGLGNKFNCKAAIFRLGLIEIVKFLDLFYHNARLSTVFESSSVADLLLSCFYGRDRRVTEAMVARGLSLAEAERDLLNGKPLVGAHVARDVSQFLRRRDVEEMFPLFAAVHKVFAAELHPDNFFACIRSHPEHNLRLQRLSW